jgi:hypothetical protein
MQGDRRQAGLARQPSEPLGDVLRVLDLAVLAGEHQAGVDPGRRPRQALLELPDPVRLEGSHGEGVEGKLPAAAGVLPSATMTGRLSTTTTVWTTASRPGEASRSTARQGRPSSSLRRMPVVAKSSHIAARRSSLVASKKARSSSADHTPRSRRGIRGGSAASATLRATNPQRTASPSALCSTWTWRTLLGLSPPRPSRRPCSARSAYRRLR